MTDAYRVALLAERATCAGKPARLEAIDAELARLDAPVIEVGTAYAEDQPTTATHEPPDKAVRPKPSRR